MTLDSSRISKLTRLGEFLEYVFLARLFAVGTFVGALWWLRLVHIEDRAPCGLRAGIPLHNSGVLHYSGGSGVR